MSGTDPVSIDNATGVTLSGGNNGASATPATVELAGVTFTAKKGKQAMVLR